MLSVFCASHSRLHWPVAFRWRASLSSSICSRSFFQRRYSALSLPVMDMVMSTEPFGPGLRLCRNKERQTAGGEKFRESHSGRSAVPLMRHFFRDSLSTLSPSLFQSSRCQSPALPSSSRASCCPLYGPCPVPDQSVSDHPGSCGLACLRPAGGEKYCYSHVDSCSCFHLSHCEFLLYFSSLKHKRSHQEVANTAINRMCHTRCPRSYSAILSISSFIFSIFCRLFSSHSCPESQQHGWWRIQDEDIKTKATKIIIKMSYLKRFFPMFDIIMNLRHVNELCRD